MFTPAQITGLQLWFDANDATTLYQDAAMTTPATLDNDVVGAWKDKSGNNKHATQGTTANKPKLKLSTQNSLPAVLGDTTDYLQTASIAHGIGTGDFYVCAVIRTTTNPVWSCMWANGSFAPGFYAKSAVSKLGVWWDSEKAFAAALSQNTTYLVELWRASGTLRAAINGVQDANSFSVSTSVANATSILFQSAAGSEPLVGYIAELLFVNNYPSAQIASLRSYLNQKWEIYVSGASIAPPQENELANAERTINWQWVKTRAIAVLSVGAAVATYLKLLW